MRVTLCVFLSVCFALCFVSSFLFSFISIYSTRGNLGLLRRLMIMIIIICGSCVASSLVYLSITFMNTVEVPSKSTRRQTVLLMAAFIDTFLFPLETL